MMKQIPISQRSTRQALFLIAFLSLTFALCSPLPAQFDREVFRGYKKETVERRDSLDSVITVVQFRTSDTIGDYPDGHYTIKSRVLDSAAMIQSVINKTADQYGHIGTYTIQIHQAKQTADSLKALVTKLAGSDVYTPFIVAELQKTLPGKYWLTYSGQTDSVNVRANGRIERARNGNLLFTVSPVARNWVVLTYEVTESENKTDVFYYPTATGRKRWAGISSAGPLILLKRE